MNSGWERATPLLSQEGWPGGPGWFQSETLQQRGFGTTPRVIAMQSRCPPNLGGQFPLQVQARFIHTFCDRAYRPYSSSFQIRTLCVSFNSKEPTTNVMPATAIG